jgi:hypothetical protein
MPDAWETTHGLDPNDSADRNAVAASGYTMLEEYLNSIAGQTGIVSAGERAVVPTHLELEQNYPNPFNPRTAIAFQLSDSRFVTLTVYDLLGTIVATLVHERLMPGTYIREFDATGLASGVYLYRIEAGSSVGTKKLIVLR